MGTTILHDNALSIVGFISRELWVSYEKVLKLVQEVGIYLLTKMMSNFLISIITLYKRHLSKFNRASCIYTPSCSNYSMEAISKYGAFKGVMLTIRRLLRCRHSYKGGYDPVV